MNILKNLPRTGTKMEKRIQHKKIVIHRGMFDQVEIGIAKIIIEKNGYFDKSTIVEIEISKPFKEMIKFT